MVLEPRSFLVFFSLWGKAFTARIEDRGFQ